MRLELDKKEVEDIIVDHLSSVLANVLKSAEAKIKISTGISYSGVTVEIAVPENDDEIQPIMAAEPESF